MWQILGGCPIIGTDHIKTNIPCQDSAGSSEVIGLGQRYFIGVVSDGAGSASNSSIGSRIVTETILAEVSTFVQAADRTFTTADEWRDNIRGWIKIINQSIEIQSEHLGTSVREFAATMVLAIIGETFSVFAQIGDGCIVWEDAGILSVAFWPHQSEFLNETSFITSNNSDNEFKDLRVLRIEQRLNRIAVMSDGIEILALNFASQSAYPGFFNFIFKKLEETNNLQELNQWLDALLSSERVTCRTGDDKTVLFATRPKLGISSTQVILNVS